MRVARVTKAHNGSFGSSPRVKRADDVSLNVAVECAAVPRKGIGHACAPSTGFG